MAWRRWVLLMVMIWCAVGGRLAMAAELAQRSVDDAPPPEIIEKQTILTDILRTVDQLEQELKAKQQELRSPQGEGRKEELLQEIHQLSARLKILRDNLQKIASSVDLDAFSDQGQAWVK